MGAMSPSGCTPTSRQRRTPRNRRRLPHEEACIRIRRSVVARDARCSRQRPSRRRRPAKKAAPAQPALDPDRKAAAEEVVKLTGVEETNDASLTEQANELRTGSLVQQEVDRSPANEGSPAEESRSQWTMVMKRFGERQADILDEVKVPAEAVFHDRLVRAYATKFSLDELKAIDRFLPVAGWPEARRRRFRRSWPRRWAISRIRSASGWRRA